MAAETLSLNDPFVEEFVVIGASSAARWCRHHLAQKNGIFARVRLITPEAAVEGLLASATDGLPWSATRAADPRWSPAALAERARLSLVENLDDDALIEVRAYLMPAGTLDPWRLAALARDVARVIVEWARMAPQDAADCEGDAWFYVIARALELGRDPVSPARRRLAPIPELPALRFWGVERMPPGDEAVVEKSRVTRDPYGPLDQATGTLGALQARLRGDDVVADYEASTIRFSPSYTASREVEALRHALLTWFDQDRTLAPHDVLILTPDLPTYAPLVQGIFARSPSYGEANKDGPPSIPVALAGVALTATNPVADALSRVLDLCAQRPALPALLDLLALPLVHARFGLTEADLPALSRLAEESGARWGLDVEDRAAHGVRHSANTLQFGMERVALGAIFSSEDLVLDEEDPISPLSGDGRDHLARAGHLAHVFRLLRHTRRALRPLLAPPAAWRAALRETVDAWLEIDDKRAWMRLQLVEVLDRALPDSPAILDLRAIIRLLRAQFELPAGGEGAITSAVTVAALEPHRATPHRVIALLGMSDGAFPTLPQPPAWHPAGAAWARFQRESQAEGLERILRAATSHLFVGWQGFSERSGEPFAPCAAVTRLVELLGDTGADLLKRAQQAATRQPWSPRATSYDPEYLRASVAAPVAPPLPALPPEDAARFSRQIPIFVKELINGPKALLNGRLRAQLPAEVDPLPSREPIEMDHLSSWKWTSARLAAPQGDAAAWTRGLRARGVLPPGGAGLAEARDIDDKAQNLLQTALRAGGSPAPLPTPLHAEIEMETGVLRLTGAANTAHAADGRVVLQTVTPSHTETLGERTLELWIALLLAVAQGEPVAGAQLIGWAKDKALLQEFAAPTPEEARAQLRDLAALWRAARTRMMPLFPELSRALAEQLVVAEDGSISLPPKGYKDVSIAWIPSYNLGHSKSAKSDPYVAQALGDLNPPWDWGPWSDPDHPDHPYRLALVLWGPLIRALAPKKKEGKKSAKESPAIIAPSEPSPPPEPPAPAEGALGAPAPPKPKRGRKPKTADTTETSREDAGPGEARDADRPTKSPDQGMST